ncbi:hypothetical protein [Neptuniibacter halophilus]|uniref:hypothetical protein n=1 Tax=Neptuniibacter halophilus TaxID=651666 RepID=UPI002573598B|nr:hypothetical protein [Neptuniibacter halophilus]
MKKVKTIAGALIACTTVLIAQPAEALSREQLLENCKPLLDLANKALSDRKMKTAIEANAIDGGGALSEASCVDNLLDFEFDAFMNVGGFEGLLGGLFESMKGQVKDSLKNMTCDFADDLKAESDTFLSCTANMSVDLAVAGQLPTPSLESCLGTGLDGSGYDFSFSGGNGNYGISERFETGGGTSSSTGTQSSQQLLDAIGNKVNQLNQMGGQ